MKLALTFVVALFMAFPLFAFVPTNMFRVESDTTIVTCNGNQDTLFVPTLINDLTICEHFPVKLADDVTSTNTYSWSPAAGLSNPSISGPFALAGATETYVLTVTTVNGCEWKDSVKVTITPVNLDISGSDTIKTCLGSTAIQLTATPSPLGSVVSWSPAEAIGSISANTITLNELTESVTIIASTQVPGCPGPLLDSVFIRVDSIPVFELAADPAKPFYCPGDTVYFKLVPVYVPGPATESGLVHHWDPYGTQLTPLENPLMVIIATDSNTYVLHSQIGVCAERADSIFIPVPRVTVDFTVSPDTICEGGSAQITVTADPANTKLEWEEATSATLTCENGTNPAKNCPVVTANPTVTTTYHVTTPDAACPTGADITVNVTPLPIVSLVDKVSCAFAPVVLNGVVEPGVTYLWTPNVLLNSNTVGNPTASPSAVGEFNYHVVANRKGCIKEGDVKLTAVNASVSAGSDISGICFGAPVTLTATASGTTGGSIQWEGFAAGNASINFLATSLNTTYTVTYTYGGASNNACEAEDEVQVSTLPRPTIGAITGGGEEVCFGAKTVLLLDSTGTSDGRIAWYDNNGLIANQNLDSLVVTPQTDNLYYATLTDDAGCSVTSDTITVATKRCFEIPNAFTPNGDGFNDTFRPLFSGGTAEVLNFAIFSRWGEKVFESTSQDQIAWDGKIKGKDASSDVYVYRLRIRFGNGEILDQPGEVTLIR